MQGSASIDDKHSETPAEGMGHSVLSLVFALVVDPLVWVGLAYLAAYLIGFEETKTLLGTH